MNQIDLRVLLKNLEDAMYAIAEAQSEIRASIWMVEKETRFKMEDESKTEIKDEKAKQSHPFTG